MEKIMCYYDYLKSQKDVKYKDLIYELAISKHIFELHDLEDESKLGSIMSAGFDIYNSFFDEILRLEKEEPQSNLILQLVQDFVDVRILNPTFVEEISTDNPLWGGNEVDKYDCPAGHVNVNWHGYQKYYAVGWGGFEKFVFNDILIEPDCFSQLNKNIHKVMACVTLELTMYGVDNYSRAEFGKEMNRRIDSATPENCEDFDVVMKKFRDLYTKD